MRILYNNNKSNSCCAKHQPANIKESKMRKSRETNRNYIFYSAARTRDEEEEEKALLTANCTLWYSLSTIKYFCLLCNVVCNRNQRECWQINKTTHAYVQKQEQQPIYIIHIRRKHCSQQLKQTDSVAAKKHHRNAVPFLGENATRTTTKSCSVCRTTIGDLHYRHEYTFVKGKRKRSAGRCEYLGSYLLLTFTLLALRIEHAHKLYFEQRAAITSCSAFLRALSSYVLYCVLSKKN